MLQVVPAHLAAPPTRSCSRNAREEPHGAAESRAWLSRLKHGYTVGQDQPLAHALPNPARSKGIRMSLRIASAVHLPDALIHRTPSSLIDLIQMLPVLACVSSGSLPIRADSSRSGASSAWFVAGVCLLIHASNLSS